MKRETYNGVAVLLIMIFCSLTALPVQSANTGFTQLMFKNYLGNTENIHPKVLYFENGWKGHKFWMAYTPYPSGHVDAENPSIAVSEDGVNWRDPKNLEALLDVAPEVGYNSDTHLVYRADIDRLECWYRTAINEEHLDCFKKRVTDGQSWSEIEIVVPWCEEDHLMRLCPVILCEDNKYVVYYVKPGINSIVRIVSGENYNTKEWSKEEVINLHYGNGLLPWHMDFTPSQQEGWYEVVYQLMDKNNVNSKECSIYHSRYNPSTGESTVPRLLIEPDRKQDSLMGRGLYRASFVYAGEIQYLYFSSIDYNRHRHMFVAYGKNLIEDLANGKYNAIEEVSATDDNFRIVDRQIQSLDGEEISVYDLYGVCHGNGMKVTLSSNGLFIIRKGSKAVKVII